MFTNVCPAFYPFKMAAHGDTYKHSSWASLGWWALHLIHTGLEFSTLSRDPLKNSL